MDFNDYAFALNERVALQTIASRLAPTRFYGLPWIMLTTKIPVGASLLAMDFNDNAFALNERIALRTIVGTPRGASLLLRAPARCDFLIYISLSR
ncbi:hypothetical protein [Pseudomonas fluorescens]|uniref:Uncharacterized protein n=2 Tax=Pseudomonas fluorescens TaxID=294 RepID=A0A5E7G4W1_PSEFL|nr:hypothetical protein [Pseudomonas fluorescens]VVO44163.1 hypothetical protein PS833_06343 [Pseudomonas fluorescens]VVQ11177.1 hypothetical protein PS914_05200 [Pseudomonas fluorescens]